MPLFDTSSHPIERTIVVQTGATAAQRRVFLVPSTKSHNSYSFMCGRVCYVASDVTFQ